MRALSGVLILLLLAACGPAAAGRVEGEVTQVSGGCITASFPMPVVAHAMMIVLAGEGEAVAGLAISDRCRGAGPYDVTGKLSFVSDPSALAVGKRVYVNSANVKAVAARPAGNPHPVASFASPPCPRPSIPDQDLKFYYYAAGQTVGYGALGFGYERTVRLARRIGIEFDGGITALGNVSAESADIVNTDQLIKSLNGRLRLDVARGAGFYAGYRWNRGRGDWENWDKVVQEVGDGPFVAPSEFSAGTVQSQGLEYGITLRPAGGLSLSLGYIPKYRTDFGSLGVLSQPAYSAELRLGSGRGALRLRGLKSEDYWQADLGVTIR